MHFWTTAIAKSQHIRIVTWFKHMHKHLGVLLNTFFLFTLLYWGNWRSTRNGEKKKLKTLASENSEQMITEGSKWFSCWNVLVVTKYRLTNKPKLTCKHYELSKAISSANHSTSIKFIFFFSLCWWKIPTWCIFTFHFEMVQKSVGVSKLAGWGMETFRGGVKKVRKRQRKR